MGDSNLRHVEGTTLKDLIHKRGRLPVGVALGDESAVAAGQATGYVSPIMKACP